MIAFDLPFLYQMHEYFSWSQLLFASDSRCGYEICRTLYFSTLIPRLKID
jgi:hypothetical protein